VTKLIENPLTEKRRSKRFSRSKGNEVYLSYPVGRSQPVIKDLSAAKSVNIARLKYAVESKLENGRLSIELPDLPGTLRRTLVSISQ